MVFCHECGIEVAKKDEICSSCGVLLIAVADTSVPASAEVPVAIENSDHDSKTLDADEPVIETTPVDPIDKSGSAGAKEETPTEVTEDPTVEVLPATGSTVDETVVEALRVTRDSLDTGEPAVEEVPVTDAKTPLFGPPEPPVKEHKSDTIDIAEPPAASENLNTNEPAPTVVPQSEVKTPLFGVPEPDIEKQKIDTADVSESPAEIVSETRSAPVGGETSHPIGSETDGKRPGLKPLGEGTILNDRYQIVRKIGGGGMGAVYLALDQNLGGVERAVKEMVQSSIEEEQQKKAIDDFKRESMILSTLDHPSIPTIYDYFYDNAEGRFYLVMKYISGGDLAGRLRSEPGGRIDEKTITEWAVEISDVLAYLHELPTTIVYRDLKPSNVMIDGKTGRTMLIDFGIARSINQEEKGVTAVGTMGYAPPELFSGQVEPRSDIYSLGSTMFHLLTGADPQNNPLLIFDFQKNPRPRQINPQLSDQMERVLMRCVEYSAASRFTSAAELRSVLTDHLENLRTGNITFGVTEIPAAVSLANQSVFCGFCGQRIVATDLFCAFCGAKQPIAQQGVHAEIYGRSGATAKLVIDGTSELDTPAYTLEKNENLLGRRDPQSNIFPEVDLSKFDPDTKISRRHARIWREGGNFLVEDLGSSNGTLLMAGMSDSVRLQPRTPHTLTDGDRLRLGDTTLHFLMG